MIDHALTRKPLAAPFTASGSAPCKINLTLDVFAPRPDGFHDLSSLVVPMAFPADTVTVSTNFLENTDAPTQITLTCDDPTLPTDDTNLAFRAARDFAQAFLPPTGIQIGVDLIKRLPYQAGLGGGSSDAATVLRLLAGKRFGHHLDANRPELNAIAAKIGSDVPLFLPGGPVEMSGRGEFIKPFRLSLPPLFGVLVKPAVGVPTVRAYGLLDALPSRQNAPGYANTGFNIEVAITQNQVRGADDLGPLLHNDFEAAVLPAFYQVFYAHQALQEAGAVRALLCGSGSAIFGLARDRDHARELVNALQNRFPYVAETSTLAADEPTEGEPTAHE